MTPPRVECSCCIGCTPRSSPEEPRIYTSVASSNSSTDKLYQLSVNIIGTVPDFESLGAMVEGQGGEGRGSIRQKSRYKVHKGWSEDRLMLPAQTHELVQFVWAVLRSLHHPTLDHVLEDLVIGQPLKTKQESRAPRSLSTELFSSPSGSEEREHFHHYDYLFVLRKCRLVTKSGSTNQIRL